MAEPIIQCENLVKIYKTKDLEVLALQGLELTIEKGELMAIIGNSGSGKSTFLNMIGGLDRPSAGRLIVDGKDLFKLDEKALVEYKKRTVGFVWQNNARNLLPYLSAWQNVQMPMLLESGRAKKQRALELLELVGLSQRKNNRLSQLSGGEQQRVAIAIGQQAFNILKQKHFRLKLFQKLCIVIKQSSSCIFQSQSFSCVRE